MDCLMGDLYDDGDPCTSVGLPRSLLGNAHVSAEDVPASQRPRGRWVCQHKLPRPLTRQVGGCTVGMPMTCTGHRDSTCPYHLPPPDYYSGFTARSVEVRETGRRHSPACATPMTSNNRVSVRTWYIFS